MKSLIWILYSFLVLIIFSDIQAQNNQETIIKGKIINSGTENIYFKYNNIIDTVNLNNNKFELKIIINSPQYLYCFLGMAQYFPVYIFPGDVITVDFEKLTKDYKLTFGGNTNPYLNYFNELDNSLTSIYNDTSFYQKDSLFLFARIDSIYNIKIERFNKLKSLNPDLDKNFYNYEKRT